MVIDTLGKLVPWFKDMFTELEGFLLILHSGLDNKLVLLIDTDEPVNRKIISSLQ